VAQTTESIEGVFAFSDLSAETQSLVERVRETKRPLVITKDGQHTVVLVEAEQYELQQRRLSLMERIERGKRDIAEGRFRSQEEVEAMMDEWLDGHG
jgi:prevent-host-death family protein